MTPIAIQDPADIARLSAQPYEQYQPFDNVLQALEQSAREHAGRRALTYIESPDPAQPARSWTYAEFTADVRRAANLFRRLAGERAPRVAMLLPNIPQAWFTLLGAETAGILCPINYLLGADHVAELVEATGASVLVALGPHAELDIWSRVAAVRARCPQLQVLAVGAPAGETDFDAALAAEPGDRLQFDNLARRDTVAALFHTGGTTGRPKLAQHAHGNQLHVSTGAAQMYGMGPQDVMLNGFPLFHVAGSFVYGLSTLMAGAELVLPTLLGMRNKGFVDRYWEFVHQHGITLLAGVPTIMSTLMGSSPSREQTRVARAMLTGGSPLPDELAEDFERRFELPVRNILGMTECAGVISIEPVAGPRVRGSCGLPLPFTRVCAIDGEGRELPAGQTGVLKVRGPNVGPGYTEAERNPGTFEDGWLITGDIGHVDEAGRVFITGRAKDVIVRSGHNIDPRLIEDALMRHPAVLMAAAVGEPDEYAGELPVAYVVLKPGEQADPVELAAFSRQHIPERPAYPKRVELIEALPLTAVGKVFKPALRLSAIRHALADRLGRAGLDGRVGVDVIEAGSVTEVVFSAAAGEQAGELEASLRRLMTPFALRWRLDQGVSS
ncbi:AMP-binding protein [Ramlibacter sp. AW1]|uniref:AMP-binding protein n=1 Tax=Ramlibacter aurantiacus TaxID=2801330 RepID=A0A936ZWB7_9BURK|nr:AMP-binding protein [Ramlibacter aurantiacus]MBL0421739.1 AMP-binding protein [Ramlibacter aurantiacus]